MANVLIDEVINNQGTKIQVVLVADDDSKTYQLSVTYVDLNIDVVDSSYPNARVLSADLAAELGLGPAAALLERNGVPRTNPLWDLNHSDLWEI